MAIYKRVVNVRTDADGKVTIEQSYGPQAFPVFEVDRGLTIEELFEKVLRLSPGDRVELNYLDDRNPYPRIGKPRPGAGRKPNPNLLWVPNLRACRAQAGLTQRGLAQLAQVGHMTMANAERGTIGVTPEVAAKFAGVLGVAVEDLTGRNGAE